MTEPEAAKPPPSLAAIERATQARIAAVQAALDELPRLTKALAALRGEEYVAPPDTPLPEYLQIKVQRAVELETQDLRGQLEAVTQRNIMLEHRIDEERKDHAFKEEERAKLRRTNAEQGAAIRELKERLERAIRERDEATGLLERETAPPAVEPEKPPETERKQWRGGTTQLVKPEQVRDVIQQHLRSAPFRLGQVLPHFPGVSDQTIKRRIAELVESGVLKVEGKGAGTRYVYVKPSGSGPLSRPNHASAVERAAGVGSQAAKRGQIVPHTKAEGPSGKPGLDKKRSAKGVRVKRERQGT